MPKKNATVRGSELDKLLRDEGSTLLPAEGGWCVFFGFPIRGGHRVPRELREAGIKHLDIYWGFNEHCTWKFDYEVSNSLDMDGDTIGGMVCDLNFISDSQLTLITLHTPVSETVNAWKGEVRWFKQDVIDQMLAEGYLDTIPIGGVDTLPTWDDVTRDMVGGLMLDGMSYAEAQRELLDAGEEFDPHVKLPKYFFRARPGSEFYNAFSCEYDEEEGDDEA